MKKSTLIAATSVIALLLTACGESQEKSISGEVQNIVTDNSVSTDSSSGSGEGENNDNAAASDSAKEAFSFKSSGVVLEIDGKAQDYVEKLGEPVSYYEATSCAFGDLDKIYTYSGFEMDTYQTNGIDYVSAIILQDDSASTPEGACIGDAADSITKLYGEPTSQTDGTYIYVRDNMKLCFIVESDKIASIQYLSTMLD